MSWEYLNPTKIIFGEGKIYEIERILINSNCILLVTDKYLSSSEIIKRVKNILRNKKVIFFDKVEPNPSSSCINECGKLGLNNKVDTVIGIGGGSSLDTAKASALVSSTGIPIEEYLDGKQKIENPILPVVAIPTTAGTGSEVTPVAVINHNIKKRKQPIASEFLFPRFAVVDPELTWSMPPSVTASTGIDALSHGIEAYWSKSSTDITDALAIACINKVLRFLKRAFLNGEDTIVRREMSLAALLGGLSFALPKTAAVHACSFPLTYIFNIPHGTACGLTLVPFIKFNYPVIKDKMDYLFQCTGYNSLENFCTAILTLQKEIGLPSTLSECGVKKDDIEMIVNESFHPNILNNPRDVTKKDLFEIYEEIL